MAQIVSATRIKNFLRRNGIEGTRVFDGGIAPQTLVPHWLHFAEYHKFQDVDPLEAIRHNELEAQEVVAKLVLKLPANSVPVVVGGPMTGLHQLIVRCPAVVSRFKELHAMFATWGKVPLMQFEDSPRGAVQFNVFCDPQAAHAVLTALQCPIYLLPTEVTRVKEIGFENAKQLRDFLPDNAGTQALHNLYALWYEAAVKPRQAKNADELIFIHDLSAVLSLTAELRNQIYTMVPIEITSVPHLSNEAADWGKVIMQKTDGATQIFAATALSEGGAAVYLETLKKVFA
jgi:pyrimidine-specific ribonucleoside hydrolase